MSCEVGRLILKRLPLVAKTSLLTAMFEIRVTLKIQVYTDGKGSWHRVVGKVNALAEVAAVIVSAAVTTGFGVIAAPVLGENIGLLNRTVNPGGSKVPGLGLVGVKGVSQRNVFDGKERRIKNKMAAVPVPLQSSQVAVAAGRLAE